MTFPRWTVLVLLVGILAGCRLQSENATDPPNTASQADVDTTAAAADTPLPDTLAQQAQDAYLQGLLNTLDTLAVQQDSLIQALSGQAESAEDAMSRLRAARINQLLGTLDTLTTKQEAIIGELEGLVEQEEQPDFRFFRYYGWRAVLALTVLFITWFVIRAVLLLLRVAAKRRQKTRNIYERLIPIVRIMLWIFATVFVLRVIFNVEYRSFLAAATAIGVGIGFAAQDLLKNIFGGLMIVFDQPFKINDKISVGGTYGKVISIGLRSTRIVTPDDNVVSVPNAQIVDGQVSNANDGANDCQVVTDLYLPGWVDEAKAKKIAYQAAVSSRYVYLKKPIVVLVKDEFRETFLTLVRVKAYVLDIDHEFLLMSDITERARAEFRRQGLIVPTYGTPADAEPTDDDDEPPAKEPSKEDAS